MLSTIAGLPGNSVARMVKDNSNQPFQSCSAWQPPTHMSPLLDPGQVGCLPSCIGPGMCTSSGNLGFPGFIVPSIQSVKLQPSNEAHVLPQFWLPHSQNLLPTDNQHVKANASFCGGFGGETKDVASPRSQRRFVIFDQSGDETRLIYSSFCPNVLEPRIGAANPLLDCCWNHVGHPALANQVNPTKVELHDSSGESRFGDKKNEMHEDTEDINALLDSDDNDDDDDDDDVRSTGHSPILIGETYGKRNRVEEMQEIACSDFPYKKQKLLDDTRRKSSLMDTAGPVKAERPQGYCSDVESSNTLGKTQEKMVSVLGNKQFVKDKICATLKILESIFPGAKDKDPLLVLDQAIDYLKSLKLKAKALGVDEH